MRPAAWRRNARRILNTSSASSLSQRYIGAAASRHRISSSPRVAGSVYSIIIHGAESCNNSVCSRNDQRPMAEASVCEYGGRGNQWPTATSASIYGRIRAAEALPNRYRPLSLGTAAQPGARRWPEHVAFHSCCTARRIIFAKALNIARARRTVLEEAN